MWTKTAEAVSLRDFSGGRLSICDTEHDVFHKPLLYGGQEEHWVTPHKDIRTSLTCLGSDKLNTSESATAAELGSFGISVAFGSSEIRNPSWNSGIGNPRR
jgi:hypothetical protein